MLLLICFPVHQSPYEKRSTLKGKTLLPLGANSFLLEWTHFHIGAKTILTEFPDMKVCQFSLMKTARLIMMTFFTIISIEVFDDDLVFYGPLNII